MARDYRRVLADDTDPVAFTEAVATLYDDAEFDAQATTAILQALRNRRDGAASDSAVAGLSDADLALIAETMTKRANGGLFVLRNGALTVGDANITTDHVIRMESASPMSSGDIVEYTIVEADPDALEVGARAVDSNSLSRFGVGQLLYGDRFTVIAP